MQEQIKNRVFLYLISYYVLQKNWQRCIKLIIYRMNNRIVFTLITMYKYVIINTKLYNK